MRKTVRRILTVGLLGVALALLAVPTASAAAPVEGDFAATVASVWSDFVAWLSETVGLPADDSDVSGAPRPEGGNTTNGGGDSGDEGPGLDPEG